jgi:hypothetical protein
MTVGVLGNGNGPVAVGEEGLLRVQIWRPLQAYISFGFVTEENNERECSALQG